MMILLFVGFIAVWQGLLALCFEGWHVQPYSAA